MENFKLKNRQEAGILLAEKLLQYKNTDAVVLGIPRGGIPVAIEVAKRLNLPLDLLLSKKIGHPFNKEFAIGAVSMDSIIINNDSSISKEYINAQISEIKELLKKRYSSLKGDGKPVSIKHKTVIIVDDGIATGLTLLASIEMLKKKEVNKIVVAAPVVPLDRTSVIKDACDEFVYLYAPEYFDGVGAFYIEFEQVQDNEVKSILDQYKLEQ